jgi:hypothetical protein
LFPSANIEYKWSPLSVDVVSKLKSIRTAGFASAKPLPDLLVAGVGAWDKLHMAATDEDQQSHREVISKLALELDKLREQGVSVVWVIPPVINTPALNSDEKRAQMSEESLEETRQLYRDLGVEGAASFVLEGAAFTKDRKSDSFDGIDYPPDVYDAGIQILANALDWILAPSADEPEGLRPDADIMVNPFLGAQVLIFAVIGLFVSCVFCLARIQSSKRISDFFVCTSCVHYLVLRCLFWSVILGCIVRQGESSTFRHLSRCNENLLSSESQQ